MWPNLFTIDTGQGVVPVHTWGLMITLAFLAAAWVAQSRSQRTSVDGDKLVGMYLVAFLCGLGGARLLHFAMAEPGRFFADPLVYFRIWEGGFAFYGGVIIAALGCIAYAMVRGIPVWQLADLCSPAIMIGLAVGRIGCFFAGCCHGAAHELPADAFNLLPDSFSGGALYLFGSPPFLLQEVAHGVGMKNQPMLPTQLWACATSFGLFLLLSWRWRNRRYDGQVFVWLLLLYPLVRSTIEHFRGDTIRGVDWLGLFTTSQLVSIPVFAVGLTIAALRRGKGRAEVRRDARDEELLKDLLGKN